MTRAQLPDGTICDWDERLRTVGAVELDDPKYQIGQRVLTLQHEDIPPQHVTIGAVEWCVNEWLYTITEDDGNECTIGEDQIYG